MAEYAVGGEKFVLYTIATTLHIIKPGRRDEIRPAALFAVFWTVLFLLYLPAARAGWVSDTLGWLEAVRRQSFPDFVARKGYCVRSFYQLTQIVTWSLYQMFGANRWLWHLLHISLHALNAALLFSLLRGIFKDSRVEGAEGISIIAAGMFCAAPYVSEVIVWEAAFHFLQGLLLLLIQLRLLRSYLHSGRTSLAALASGLAVLSFFSLETFYLIPVFGAALCVYYHLASGWDSGRTKDAFLKIVVPQAVSVLLHVGIIRFAFGGDAGRLGNTWTNLPLTYYLVKPPEYVFHLLGGRFLPADWRAAVYHTCSSYAGAGLFYLALGALILHVLLRFRRMTRVAQAGSLLFVWLLLAITLVSPLWFPERLLITGDRYLYMLLPAFCGLAPLALVYGIRNVRLRLSIVAVIITLLLSSTWRVNRLWQASQLLTDRLQDGLSDAPGKITILLNSPASLCGAPMIGAGEDNEAQLMHNLLYPRPLRAAVMDAPAMQLLQPGDSISISIVAPQIITVALQQPAAFWQYGPDVAHSFSNAAFSVMIDNAACCYLLRLSGPAARYRLLYQASGRWHELKMPAL